MSSKLNKPFRKPLNIVCVQVRTVYNRSMLHNGPNNGRLRSSIVERQGLFCSSYLLSLDEEISINEGQKRDIFSWTSNKNNARDVVRVGDKGVVTPAVLSPSALNKILVFFARRQPKVVSVRGGERGGVLASAGCIFRFFLVPKDNFKQFELIYVPILLIEINHAIGITAHT